VFDAGDVVEEVLHLQGGPGRWGALPARGRA
jgi:hypothetical protein